MEYYMAGYIIIALNVVLMGYVILIGIRILRKITKQRRK